MFESESSHIYINSENIKIICLGEAKFHYKLRATII